MPPGAIWHLTASRWRWEGVLITGTTSTFPSGAKPSICTRTSAAPGRIIPGSKRALFTAGEPSLNHFIGKKTLRRGSKLLGACGLNLRWSLRHLVLLEGTHLDKDSAPWERGQ